MKIAHISDLHIDAVNNYENYLHSEQLLEFICSRNFDHIIISGDVTENGDKSSFELARNLFKRFGLLKPEKLTLTIGNHDIYGGVHLAEDIINYPKRCMATSFYRKVNEFVYYFREAFDNVKQVHDNVFPCLKVVDELSIIIFNSNTFYSYLKNPFASNGKISNTQLKNAGKLLENKLNIKKIIAVTHHHFNKPEIDHDLGGGAVWQAIEKQTMKLRGKKKIISEFRNLNISAVLHGHLHENREYIRKNLKFLNAGGSVLGNNYLSFNSITINANKILTEKIQLKKPVISGYNTQLNEFLISNVNRRILKLSHN